MAWFELTGSNPTQSSDYTLNNTPSCGGQDQICAVQATPDTSGQKPILSAALKDEMILALHNRTASTNVQLRD
ncbi:hypothetical protein KO02_13300 [Sphingobacterium sp. ML3W]|uniref:hypothetical protein n=1 Tax=Sphingobacterium sp. ML3W TaxID=1538644 RepID=UPI0004F5D582|nr:hypothetical protein [Sphingobacterium sp. ML3W]AIM37554.1 hypothetical protein KO02_13300 [Sphingobacterium sp. ML3W]